MRIKFTPLLRVSRDPEQKYVQFGPDETMVARVIDQYLRQFNGDANVAATMTETLSLGDIAAVKGVWLEASGDCQVKLNGSALALQLRAAGTSNPRAMLIAEAEITQIEVIAGATSVDLVYVLWGDTAL